MRDWILRSVTREEENKKQDDAFLLEYKRALLFALGERGSLNDIQLAMCLERLKYK